jgi:hypothetical protein
LHSWIGWCAELISDLYLFFLWRVDFVDLECIQVMVIRVSVLSSLGLFVVEAVVNIKELARASCSTVSRSHYGTRVLRGVVRAGGRMRNG